MKKTITINLSGLVFHIEENAYGILQEYFNELKRIFSSQEGDNEIIADIEARFAELFQEKISDRKEVITESDVNEVIAIMGAPSQFDDEEAVPKKEEYYTHETNSRRLFRDPDEKIFGGVASGIAHYFNVDPVLIRVLWVIITLLGGSGILIYLIALILIPKAETTSQKLQMRGKSITVDSIKDFAESASEEVKKGFTSASNSIRETAKSERFVAFSTKLTKIIGVFLLFIGIVSISALLFAFFLDYGSVTINDTTFIMSSVEEIGLIFADKWLAVFTILIIAIIPLIFIMLIGFRMLFGKRFKLKVLAWSLLVIWGLAIIGISFLGIKSGLDFREEYKTTERILLDDETTAFHVALVEDNVEITDDSNYKFKNGYSFSNSKLGFGYVRLEVTTTSDSLYYYTIEKKSRGRNLKIAKENAEILKYTLIQNDSSFKMPTRFSLDNEQLFRNQEVKVTFFVPNNKKIVLQGNLKDYPIKINTNSTFSEAFLEKTSVWKSINGELRIVTN